MSEDKKLPEGDVDRASIRESGGLEKRGANVVDYGLPKDFIPPVVPPDGVDDADE